eukprot:m.130918 g.130918  ORF g.130918 m.130918 type:complete len:1555 (+) comp9462_c0_seq1:737-5401(+)
MPRSGGTERSAAPARVHRAMAASEGKKDLSPPVSDAESARWSMRRKSKRDVKEKGSNTSLGTILNPFKSRRRKESPNCKEGGADSSSTGSGAGLAPSPGSTGENSSPIRHSSAGSIDLVGLHSESPESIRVRTASISDELSQLGDSLDHRSQQIRPRQSESDGDEGLSDLPLRSKSESNTKSTPGKAHIIRSASLTRGYTSEPVPLPPDPLLEPLSWRETVEKPVIKKMSDKDIKRQEMIYELIQTERSFARHLHILRRIFRETIVGRDLLTPVELAAMFGNLDKIITMHAPFCERLVRLLQTTRGRPVDFGLGPIVKEAFDMFEPEVYAEFCAGQRKAADLYHSKIKSDPNFAAVLREIEAMSECNRLKFPDFIAKVMQRLSKYPLLLAGILKYSPAALAKDSALLSAALKRATYFMEHVDAQIKLAADRARLEFVQEHMDTSQAPKFKDLDITKSVLLREGSLDISVEHNAVKEIHVMLLADVVLFFVVRDGVFSLRCPGKTLRGGARSPCISLREILVRPEASQAGSILLVYTGKNKDEACIYPLCALSRVVQQAWLKDFAAAIEGAKQTDPSASPASVRTRQASTKKSSTLSRHHSRRLSVRQSARDHSTTHSIQLSRASPTEPWGVDFEPLENTDTLGLVVSYVDPKYAETTGLKAGDMILAIDGSLVDRDLNAAMELLQLKSTVDLTVASTSTHRDEPELEFHLNADGEGLSVPDDSIPLVAAHELAGSVPDVMDDSFLGEVDTSSLDLPPSSTRPASGPYEEPNPSGTPMRAATPLHLGGHYRPSVLSAGAHAPPPVAAAGTPITPVPIQIDITSVAPTPMNVGVSPPTAHRRPSATKAVPASVESAGTLLPPSVPTVSSSCPTSPSRPEEEALSPHPPSAPALRPISRALSMPLTHRSNEPVYIVVDIGATQVRLGFPHEDVPRHIVRSVVGKLTENPFNLCGNEILPLRSPLALSRVDWLQFPVREELDYSAFVDLMRYVLGRITSAPSRYVFAIDSAESSIKARLARRLRFSEALFSSDINATGVLYAEQAYLSCLGSGRRCALIVHSGDSSTYVVPVIRGSGPDQMPEPLLYAAMCSPVAGRAVSQFLADQLRSQGQVIEDINGRVISDEPSLSSCLIDDIKESVCFVSEDRSADLQSCKQSSMLEKAYELETGGSLLLGRERFECAEMLFRREPGKPPPVQDLIVAALARVRPDLQAELWANIVLSGGTTLMTGYVERLAHELSILEPTRPVAGIVAQPDRRLLPWMGASIVAAMESTRSRYVSSEAHQQFVFAREDNETCFGFETPPANMDPLESPYSTLDVLHLKPPADPEEAEESRLQERLLEIDAKISALHAERAEVTTALQAIQARKASATLPPALAAVAALASVVPMPAHLPASHVTSSPKISAEASLDPSPLRRASLTDRLSVASIMTNRLSVEELRDSVEEVKDEPIMEEPSPRPPVAPQAVFHRTASLPVENATPTKEEVATWSAARVAAWMGLNGLQEFDLLFEENGITGEDLLDLNDDDLVSMNIEDPDARALILKTTAQIAVRLYSSFRS